MELKILFQGIQYSLYIKFSVSGGIRPYIWGCRNLPVGLSFIDGVLSGTPNYLWCSFNYNWEIQQVIVEITFIL